MRVPSQKRNTFNSARAHSTRAVVIISPFRGARFWWCREPEPGDNPIEQAANVFASRLLAPACVLWGCGVQSAEDIERLCDISRAAADFRWSRMQELYRRQRFLSSPLERLVYDQFADYIKGHRLPGADR